MTPTLDQFPTFETVRCPFCNDLDPIVFERFGFQHRFTYSRCNACRLVFQSPRPVYDSQFTDLAYGDAGFYGTASNAPYWDGRLLTAKGQIVFAEYRHIVEEIERYTRRKGRILDIGCNTGFFLNVAQTLGWHGVGVEIGKPMAEAARRDFGLEVFDRDWLTQTFEKPFDAIYCSHVIEHVPNPKAWLKRMREVLAPGGVVCLSVPNMMSIDRKYKRLLKRLGLRKDKWPQTQTPDHLFEPDENSFRPFLEKEGFRVLRSYTYPSAWDGKAGVFHRLFHFVMKWGAKSRYFIAPVSDEARS